MSNKYFTFQIPFKASTKGNLWNFGNKYRRIIFSKLCGLWTSTNMKPFTINSTTSFCKTREILCSVKLYDRKIYIFIFFLPLMLLCMHDLVVLPLVCLSMLNQFKLKDTYYMFSPLSWQWTISFHLKTSIFLFLFFLIFDFKNSFPKLYP